MRDSLPFPKVNAVVDLIRTHLIHDHVDWSTSIAILSSIINEIRSIFNTFRYTIEFRSDVKLTTIEVVMKCDICIT